MRRDGPEFTPGPPEPTGWSPENTRLLEAAADAPAARDRASMERICEAVRDRTGVSLTQLRGASRRRDVAYPRQDAMLLMVEEGFSTTQIGLYLRRDHTTIVYGVRQARARRRAAGSE